MASFEQAAESAATAADVTAAPDLSWRKRFFGAYDSTARTNFYNILVHNGAPSIVAYAVQNVALSIYIEAKPEDENDIHVRIAGLPKLGYRFTKTSESEETAEETLNSTWETNETIWKWWDNEKKALVQKVRDNSRNTIGYQTYTVLDPEGNGSFDTLYTFLSLKDNNTGVVVEGDLTLKRRAAGASTGYFY